MERDQIIWLKDDDDEADETVPDDEELSGINAAMSSNRAKADLSIQVSCNSDSCHETILTLRSLHIASIQSITSLKMNQATNVMMASSRLSEGPENANRLSKLISG